MSTTLEEQTTTTKTPARPRYPVIAEAARLAEQGWTDGYLSSRRSISPHYCAVGAILAAEGVRLQDITEGQDMKMTVLASFDKNVRRVARNVKLSRTKLMMESKEGFFGTIVMLAFSFLPSIKLAAWNDSGVSKQEVVEVLQRTAYDI